MLINKTKQYNIQIFKKIIFFQYKQDKCKL